MRQGELIAERFELERVVATGGMGAVWLARDRTTGATVAVKELGDPIAAERFANEASILESLDMPGVVRYLGHGLEGGRPYLITEWLDGTDLQRVLATQGLTIAETVAMIGRLAQTLAAIHARGIVHRDVKPSNIMLVDGSPILVDFGIAQTDATAAGSTGTPAYMAPEQARGASDRRSDMFSLGCVMFACLTGVPPFRGDAAAAILAGTRRRVRLLRPEVPEPLDRLVARMLAVDPSERPEAVEVAGALGEEVSITADARRPFRSQLSGAEQRAALIVTWRGTRTDPLATSLGVAAEHEGGLVASIPTRGQASDQAARAASLALSAAGPVAIQLIAGAPRADALEHQRDGVIVDDATAILLDDRFVLAGNLVTAERADPIERAPLSGRDHELAVLLSRCDDAAERSTAQLALVTGPAGSGKSRLVRELVRALRGRDRPPAIRIERAHAPLGDELAAACSDGPAVVLLEDLQWCDGPTLRLVDAAVRSLRDRPLAMVATGRPEVNDLLPALWTGPELYQLRLGPLSGRACAQIARALVGDGAPVEALTRGSGGNPGLLEALAYGSTVAILAAIEPALDRLVPEARRALRAASLLADPVVPGDVAVLVGEDAERWLDMLENQGLLERLDDGTCRFAHPGLRGAIRATVTPEDARIVAALVGPGRPVVE